jgi:putative transposase
LASSEPATRPARRRLRLAEFDYAQPGFYFVTICTERRRCILGEVIEAGVVLSPIGTLVQQVWRSIDNHHSRVQLDEFVVMPNHLHGIVQLSDGTVTLANVIGTFKSLSTKTVNALRATPCARLWQRSYHEHVIRDESALERIREYIVNNPAKWHLDRENPANWKSAGGAGRAEPGPYK